MQDAGLNVIPVFHHGEDVNWLIRYLDEGTTYIALSPSKRAAQGEIINWLHRCFVSMA
jgi:hypothetical protein